MDESRLIGFACCYTPLALIHAAGFTPCRILPEADCPDQAGHLLHDNLCPHVKRILDRAMGRSLPPLAGMVFMNSCDAMRRLFDAWQAACPEVKAVLVDLPVTAAAGSAAFFREELQRLAGVLQTWGGEAFSQERLAASSRLYHGVAEGVAGLRRLVKGGGMPGGAAELQKACNQAACAPPEVALARLAALAAVADDQAPGVGVPVYLFGNILPDPEAFALFEACGARIAGEDLCTGARLFQPMETGASDDALLDLARGLLNRQPCARTFDPSRPDRLSREIVAQARSCQAQGVIGHAAKFCDPYLARLPSIREALKEARIPFLFLEGDCTLRAIGQQKTRIEAFIEMLR